MIKLKDYSDEYLDECMKIEEENMIIYDGWSAGEVQLNTWNGWYKELPKKVLIEGDSLVGFSIFKIIEKKLHIINLQVKKECQGKGYGSKLITDLIETAQINNLDFVSLTVFKNNPTLKLYEKLGFSIASEGREKNSFIMEKEIK
ncbi:MAG: GNAT family N-acetyltransferase [Nanoarchaeota archaeon]|nr:GNAT family N-acetyltransferase [Nanoarchaeota archaeon]